MSTPSHCAALILALALATTEQHAEAQTSFTKVTLKDGRVLEGTLLKELSDGGVKLILLSGELRELEGAAISSIERPGGKPAPPSPSEPAPPSPSEPAPPPPPTPSELSEAGARRDRPHPENLHAAEAQRSDHDGLYGGGLVGGAVAPAFPGVAGVGGVTGFLGWRRGIFDLRVGVGGFGASFPNGSLGFAAIRPEVYFFVASPYGFGLSVGPCVGYYEDNWVGGGALYGSFATVTPIALRFEAGAAFIESSLSAGAIFGSVEQSSDFLARPAVLLALAVYSQ